MSLLCNGFFNSTRCRCLGLISVSILFTLSYVIHQLVITLIHFWETSNHDHAKICDSAQIHSTHKIHTYQGP